MRKRQVDTIQIPGRAGRFTAHPDGVRVSLRLPGRVMAKLREQSDREGVSLNRLLIGILDRLTQQEND